jgi:hypothetical protein
MGDAMSPLQPSHRFVTAGRYRSNKTIRDHMSDKTFNQAGWRALARALPIEAIIAVTLLALVELFAILQMNQGHLVFSMDDPYIHFALGYHLLDGHYGINASAYAAPSSSILWPFLVAPLTRNAALLPYAVVAINFGASLVTLGCFWCTLRPHLSGAAQRWQATVVIVLAYIGTNQITLIFTGLEHSMQVALCALMAVGLIRHTQDQQVRWWWLMCIAAAPWVRYECTALSMASLGYLAWVGRPRLALLTAATMVTPMIAFSGYLKHLGLGALPSSIVVKTALNQYQSTLPSWLLNIKINLLSAKGAVMLLATMWLATTALRASTPRRIRGAAWVLTCATAAHISLGQLGFRYEIYIWACVLIFGFHTLPQWSNFSARRIWHDMRMQPMHAMAAALLLVLVGRFSPSLISTARASNNIYEQQYQMGRFVHDYLKQPVAVNDLGYVAYGNRQPVLDLWGLGSQEAIKARQSTDPQWFDKLARTHKVPYAIIYDDWFPKKPTTWLRVAELKLSKAPVFAAGDTVQFYALDCQAAAKATAALTDFKTSIPNGSTLTLHPESTQACEASNVAAAPD